MPLLDHRADVVIAFTHSLRRQHARSRLAIVIRYNVAAKSPIRLVLVRALGGVESEQPPLLVPV